MAGTGGGQSPGLGFYEEQEKGYRVGMGWRTRLTTRARPSGAGATGAPDQGVQFVHPWVFRVKKLEA